MFFGHDFIFLGWTVEGIEKYGCERCGVVFATIEEED